MREDLELLAFLAAREFLQPFKGTPMEAAINRFYAKVRQRVPAPISDHAERLLDHFFVSTPARPDYSTHSRIIETMQELPDQITRVLEMSDHIRDIARKYAHVTGMLFFGRQFNYPIAIEGALKMKEITYLYAEGHPSAELKHGIIALIRADLPSVFLVPNDAVFSKNLNNMEQVKARKGPIIAVTTEGTKRIEDIADDVIYLPRVPEFASPILNVIPLQLLSYHLAVALGRDVDKPRNLAKSVTVE